MRYVILNIKWKPLDGLRKIGALHINFLIIALAKLRIIEVCNYLDVYWQRIYKEMEVIALGEKCTIRIFLDYLRFPIHINIKHRWFTKLLKEKYGYFSFWCFW